MSFSKPLISAVRRSCARDGLSLAASCRALSSGPSLPYDSVPSCPSPTCPCAAAPPMPDGLKIDGRSPLKGLISEYAEQVLVCSGTEAWPSRIEDDNTGHNLAADLKARLGRGGRYSDPFHNISVLNASFPSSVPVRPEGTSVSAYLLPSFKYVPFLSLARTESVDALVRGYLLPEQLHPKHDSLPLAERDRLTRAVAFQAELSGVRDVREIMVLVCGHGSRDMRCGVLGPVLRDGFEVALGREGFDVLKGPVTVKQPDSQGSAAREPMNTARVGLISHIGGHKFAGNVIIYVPPNLRLGHEPHPLAGCGIWYGRVEPQNVEGLVKETILRGRLVLDMLRGMISPERRILRG